MKSFLKISALLFACVILLSAFCACKEDKTATDEELQSYSGMPEYDTANIESYVKPFDIAGFEVGEGEQAEQKRALWESVLSSAEIISYPEAQVEYYAEQERAKYRYFAKRDGIAYDGLLSSLGVTEESIYERARTYVKEDLVLEYIAKTGNVELTEEEKESLFDRYAEQLAALYGNDTEYVKENMQKQIYDTMRSDKIKEYLYVQNRENKA